MKKTILLLTVLLAVSLFAQSNYEVLLSRPDITGLTGGTATDLDGIPTVGLAVGTMVAVFDGTETRIYRLTTGTNAESSPGVIRPDDFADPANAKVWIASLSSDPEETGYSGAVGHSLDADDGSPADVVYVDSDGQVGIGTTTPEYALDVDGSIHIPMDNVIAFGNPEAEIKYDSTNERLDINVNLIETVDQQQTSASAGNVASDKWQAFTAGISGDLVSVEVLVNPIFPLSNAILRIYEGEGTGGALLSTTTGISYAISAWYKIYLSSPVPITSGNQYTWRISQATNYGFNFETGDVYPGGISSLGASDDWRFRTYVGYLAPSVSVDSDGNVGIGTDSPTSPLQVVGLPVYANNAAAIAGGLTVGAFYRTGADPDIICVVH